MLGDTAVAVHPDDDRYKDLVGKQLVHPFFPDRDIWVITDNILVDKDKGTGAVKITPLHDFNDFECGKRHNLAEINILNEDGTINQNGGEFSEMFWFDARIKVEEWMREMGLIVSKTPHAMSIGRCIKSGDIIEPLIKPQWWVKCTEMAARSLEATRSGEMKIVPSEIYD